MNNRTFDLLASKLKNAPQSVIERVIGYVDALVEPNNKPYKLTKQQQQQLDNQINSDKNEYVVAETLFLDLKKKYEL
ncbi:hypothetical protein [Flavobacterium sp.]|uniref:hypothetical protein n=1 Tax=Flavobacterium sp. TaxID=239 RepID=UPI003753D663